MKLPSRRRWLLWGALLPGAAWLAVFGDKTPSVDSTSLAQPQAPRAAGDGRNPGRMQGSGKPAEVPLAALLPRETLIRQSPATPVDLFSARNWTPPPAPVIAPAPPPPTAPPLPYVYAGKKHEGGVWEVYLSRGDFNFIARQGTSLEGTYVVERIEPPTMTLKYSPLGQIQNMNIGE